MYESGEGIPGPGGVRREANGCVASRPVVSDRKGLIVYRIGLGSLGNSPARRAATGVPLAS